MTWKAPGAPERRGRGSLAWWSAPEGARPVAVIVIYDPPPLPALPKRPPVPPNLPR